MEANAERECSALGGLFQQIIQDMKNGTPLWEDLVVKATKLHTCLRATIAAISAYLDAFQKIADAATNTRGATKEIGTALTRICLRHKAVEARIKTFSSAIMDCLVVPLQEKIEDWKKAVINLDKEHAKDFKRARAELKKRSTDTLRLQKKVRKGCKTGELQRKVESCMQDVNERRYILEETEKKAVRAALIEERSRFCVFVAFLKPVVDEEVAMLSELSHLQEVVVQLEKHTADPYTLPPASEQVIADLKSTDNNWTFTTPPSSPSSLGSRKSSMCSISSLNSSSSGSTKSHHSPSHHYWHRSLSQVSNMAEHSEGSNASTPAGNTNGALPNPTATWPNLQETLQFERAATAIMNDRPHTISSAYERGHQRPALTVYTFHAPEGCQSQPSSPTPVSPPQSGALPPRPPIPQRCSSLERPTVPAKSSPLAMYSQPAEQTTDCCSTQPMYVNMHELASMAASKAQEMVFPPPPPELSSDHHPEKTEGQEKESSTSESSLESSSGYGSQTMPGGVDDSNMTAHHEVSDPGSDMAANKYCTLPRTNPDLRRRPFSTSGYPSGTMRNTLLRRGSMQQQKPPPPIRRTSSISRGVSSVLPNNNNGGGSLEHLPPPPAFLLEGGGARNISNTNNVADIQRNVASSIAAEIQKRNAVGNVSEYQRTAALGIAAELQRKVAQMSDRGNQKNVEQIYAERKVVVKESSGGISVAETVRTLTELKHQPASPVSVRRTHSTRSQSCDRRMEAATGLIASLSAKLTPTLSPRHSRRHSQENANNRANRVRQWIAVRTVADPTICHDSLMDQIKRGTSLKKTRAVNDRSAPRIH
ncbi:protein MTSS 1 isoform X3 [Macrosteles quadrilineatus]|uniref:protein MTSS 1 isoform X3 n=1 Tax=Macrosteles quadrilineatus TaxID=74068 RepID=UPI0023E0B834|nr:protein MTSS 1 isoform X3 [Macrosteles quadrilineatus]